MVNAMTLVRSVCTPIVSAASSLSRTARIARPSRVLGSHHTNQISRYSTAAQNNR